MDDLANEEIIEDTPIEETPAVQEDTPVEESEPIAIEDVASKMGWSPKDNWRGNPDAWKPADQYVIDSQKISSNLRDKLNGLESQMERIVKTTGQITQQSVARARQEALDERSRAFDEGDAQAFQQADNKLQQITQQQTPEISSEGQEFIGSNKDWYGANQEATNYMNARVDYYAKQGLSNAKQLELGKDDVKAAFKELFPSTPKQSPVMNKPGARSTNTTAKGFSSLPKDAQSIALEYEAKGICKKEEFAKTYYEQGEG